MACRCFAEQLERRFAGGREAWGRSGLGARNFDRARPALKLRVQRAETACARERSLPHRRRPLTRRLVLDLPSFVTPVRVADLAAWAASSGPDRAGHRQRQERRADRAAPMEISSARLFAVSGPSVFVANAGAGGRRSPRAPPLRTAALGRGCRAATSCSAHAIADARSCASFRRWRPGRSRPFGKEVPPSEPRPVTGSGATIRRPSGLSRGRRGEMRAAPGVRRAGLRSALS